jgi:hypothetical protein
LVEVLSGDLDGNGVAEVVVPVLKTGSNGMGIGYWSVLVISPNDYGWSVDTVEVEDYNTQGSWVRHPREPGCDLIETHWVNGYDPKRGGGLYLEARWLKLDFRMTPRVDRPVLRRRYTNTFQEERSRTDGTTGPFSWLLSSQANP